MNIVRTMLQAVEKRLKEGRKEQMSRTISQPVEKVTACGSGATGGVLYKKALI